MYLVDKAVISAAVFGMSDHEIETEINERHLTGEYAEGFRAALKYVNEKQSKNIKPE